MACVLALSKFSSYLAIRKVRYYRAQKQTQHQKGEIQAIEQATKLGAELITEQTNQTATAANIQAASSTSQLQQIAQNVEDGYKSFINWVAEILKSSDEYVRLK